MADFTNFTKTNIIHHVFSKSPVSPITTLAMARNKSGHTVTSDDVFGEEIPACYEVSTDAQRKAIKANKNDLCVMNYGSTSQRCFYYNEEEANPEDNGWIEREDWMDKELFFNSKSSLRNNGTDWNLTENKTQAELDKVVKFHDKRDGYYIRSNNNNFLDGNGHTVRVLKNPSDNIDPKSIKSGDFVQQFLSPTDKIVNGIPSNGYNVLLWSNGILISEDAVSADAYIANNYAGIIQFQESMRATGTSEYVIPDKKISVWEYVGKTLTEVLNNLPTTGFKYEVIEKLPESPSEDSMGCIYLVLASKEDENNIYNEFICNKKGEGENVYYEWEQIGSTAITLPTAGSHLSFDKDTNTYNVDISDTIEDNADTVPTTKAVFDFFNNNKEVEIFDLNKFVVEHAHVRWVQKMILWGDGDNLSSQPSQNILDCLAWDCGTNPAERRVYIPHCTSFYGNNVTQKQAKIQWIKDAIKGVVKTQLVFHLDSHWTNRIIKHMFWQLDEDAAERNPNAPKYGQEGSITKTYMKPGLTVRYMAFLEDDDWTDSDYDFDTKMSKIDNDNGQTYYSSYIHATWIGENHFSKAWGDKAVEWSYYDSQKDNIARSTLWYCKDGNGCSIAMDAFTRAYCWTYTINEQQIKLIKEEIKRIKGQETHKQWHEDNGLQHIELYNIENTNTQQDNTLYGVKCAGFIFNTPYMLKLSKLYIHGYYANAPTSTSGPSGGNTDFDIYIKIIDPVSGHVLAVSDKGKNVSTAETNPGTGEFKFSEENSALLPKDTDFKVIFSSNNDIYDDTNDKTFQIALGNNGFVYPNTVQADKFPTHNKQGAFTNRYFTIPNANESDWIQTPSSYIINGQTRQSSGLSVIPYGKFNKTEEFNDVAYESLKIYQHTSELKGFMSLISDPIQIPTVHEKDLSDTTKQDAVENIAYAQICEPTYNFSKNCFLKSVTVPQDYSTTNYTQENIYLVMYGDTVGGYTDGTWEFMGCSKNSQRQQAGGEAMVFEFEKEIDLGNYKRCRFFYSRTNKGVIPLPEIGANFSGVKMAFTPRYIDQNCWVLTADNKRTFYSTFPAIISYVTYDTKSILHKDNDERHVTQEEKDRWNRIGNLKAGIDIGTKDDSFDDDDDTEGFLKNVSKLNFKGAFVNVIQKDDGTVDLWINPDNNLGKIEAASSSFTAPTDTTSKYVFGGTGYTLPTTTGTSFTRCHAVANDPTVTLKGKKEGKVDTVFSIGNITSQIKAVVYNKAGTAKATCTTDVIKSGVASKDENGIKITIGSVKEYTKADAEGGFVPGTVSLSCSVTPDISAIFGEGDTWSMKIFLVNGNSEEELYSSETYYAYTTEAATITANPSVVLKGTATYRWVSGVQYIAKGTQFNVTYGDMSNTSYMVAANATKRGTIGLTSCGSSATISGATTDTCSTVIKGATKTFTLGDDTTARTSLTATHIAISEGGDAEKTGTYNGAVWATGTEDIYNTAYFEKEQTEKPENEGYGRIVGHIDNGTLVIDSPTFDSKQPLTTGIYANQAKVYNGTLVYGSGTGNKYYVRKFKKSTSSTAGLLKMTLTAPGRVMNGSNMEIWYYPASNLTFARRIDSTEPPNGIGAASGTNDIIVTVPTTVPLKENEDFYIVVVLKNSSGKITADMKIS